MAEPLYKFPRLYVDAPLSAGEMPIASEHAHYLRTVLRRENGDYVRLFNGRDGEWLARLSCTGKRDATAILERRSRPQIQRARRVHLLFAPLKKDRLESLIECAVQLDVTDLHPVITERTEVREVKGDKWSAYIREAAEQCERLDLPVLHDALSLDRALTHLSIPVFAGLERSDAKVLNDALVPAGDCAAIVGPAGGWTDRERATFADYANIIPVSLGPNILRSETAVAAFLTRLSSK